MASEETDEGRNENCPSATCSPEYLKARAMIGGDLYRQGKITRAEAFRLAVDEAHAENTGPIEYEDNDDHEFMMTGVGADHDEYRRRESQANTKNNPSEGSD